MIIRKIKSDLVQNAECSFYKLEFNGRCYFDEFCEEVRTVAEDMRHFGKIVARMDAYSPSLKLPSSKFNSIKGMKRNDIFEFKEDRLRVYVMIDMAAREVYIVLGGKKDEQKRSIERLKTLLKSFDEKNLVLWNGKTS